MANKIDNLLSIKMQFILIFNYIKNGIPSFQIPTPILLKEFHPYFITGLAEADGSFSIIMAKDNRAKFGHGTYLRFKICLLKKDAILLELLK